jgi:hypothetical protein
MGAGTAIVFRVSEKRERAMGGGEGGGSVVAGGHPPPAQLVVGSESMERNGLANPGPCQLVVAAGAG